MDILESYAIDSKQVLPSEDCWCAFNSEILMLTWFPFFPLPENNFKNITIILFRDNTTKSNSEWWVLNLTGSRVYNHHAQALELVVFNDKVSPPSLGFLAGYG